MKREDINYIISILLIFSICITGVMGYLQSQFELRKFVPHRYFAYAALSLTALHVYLNWSKVWRFLRRMVRGKNKKDIHRRREVRKDIRQDIRIERIKLNRDKKQERISTK